MSSIYEKTLDLIKNNKDEYLFFQSLLYGTLTQSAEKDKPPTSLQQQGPPLEHYNFYTREISQCVMYLHEQHVGVLVCMDREMPGIRAYFNIKNLQISEFSYEYQLDQNIKQNQYLILKEKQDVTVLILRDKSNREYIMDYLQKVKHFMAKIPDFYDPIILKAFIKADANQNGEISWKEMKSLVSQMKVDVTKQIRDSMRAIIGQQKVDIIDFAQFEKVWKVFYCRNELVDVFQKYNREEFRNTDELLAPKLDSREFLNFLVKEQGETEETGKQLIKQMYDSSNYALSFYDFCHYIFGPANNLISSQYRSQNVDMKKPLNHYYCYSSHNTYLTGDQLFSDSRVERYLVDLQNGLRCVEIDVHDGPDGPIVKHGYTPTSAIHFTDVVQSILRFTKLNPKHTPIILSLEVHCNYENQELMASSLSQCFKNKILKINTQNDQFPTLEECIGKIIIKGPGNYQLFKKNQLQKSTLVDGQFSQQEEEEDYKVKKLPKSLQQCPAEELSLKFYETKKSFQILFNKLEMQKQNFFEKKKQLKKIRIKHSKNQQQLQSKNQQPGQKKNVNNHQKYKVSGKLLSMISMLSKANLKNQCCWESSSFSQNKLKKFLNSPNDFDQIRKLSNHKWFRSYPDGFRILSSNYNPIPALQLGIQIVAINTQSKNDINSHILNAFFAKSSQKTTGYRQKKQQGRRSDHKGNILKRAQNNLKENQDSAQNNSNIKKRQLVKAQIKFISGLRIYQNEQMDKEIPAVSIQAYFIGTQEDNERNEKVLTLKEYTEVVYNEAFNPKFNKNDLLQVKCRDPELGFLIVEVSECGRSVIPIECLKKGWRVISLYDDDLKEKQSKILCHIQLTKINTATQ